MSTTTKRPAPAEAVPRWFAGDPLTLTDRMRARLRTAVMTLLADPALAGAPDSVRLATLVSAAKTNLGNQYAVLTTGEMGRWLGVSASQVSQTVRPRLQRGPVHSVVARRDDDDLRLGLRWSVTAMLRAWREGRPDDPLRLTRPELATLLRLIEALFAPGWTDTEPGLVAWRTGHGAATVRLALLLLVLHARPDGSVRLCPGRVDARGRLAATVSRLLDCDTTAAEQVLEELEACGAVEVVPGARKRLVVPAAEKAWKAMRKAARAAGRAPARSRDRCPETPVTAEATVRGDQIGFLNESALVSPYKSADSKTDAFAPLHADHTPVVEAPGKVEVDSGCSGEADGSVSHRRRERARVRVMDHPLRGDKQQKALSRNASYPPADLRDAFEMVPSLWEYLTTAGKQRLAVRLIREELRRVAAQVDSADTGRGPDPVDVLADRLRRRAAESGGVTAARDVIGWLKGRLLPQRGCGQDLCDDGINMFSGQRCHGCAERISDARIRREQIMTEVPPGLPATQRRALCEARLAELSRARQEVDVIQQAEAAERRAEAAARAAAKLAEQERRAAHDAAQPCADCQAPRVGGLCGACSEIRRTEAAITRGVRTALASWVLRHPTAKTEQLAERAAEIEQGFRAELEAAAEDRLAAGLILAPETAVRLHAEELSDGMQLENVGELARADASAVARAQATADIALGIPQPEAERCQNCGTELTRGPRDICLPCRQARTKNARVKQTSGPRLSEEDLCAAGCGRPALRSGPHCRRCHIAAVTASKGPVAPERSRPSAGTGRAASRGSFPRASR